MLEVATEVTLGLTFYTKSMLIDESYFILSSTSNLNK